MPDASEAREWARQMGTWNPNRRYGDEPKGLNENQQGQSTVMESGQSNPPTKAQAGIFEGYLNEPSKEEKRSMTKPKWV